MEAASAKAVNCVRRDRVMIAMIVMLDIAFHAGRGGTVSAADIADRVGLARRGMEPTLQALSKAGLLVSVRGPRGGYRLGRSARTVRLSDIAEVLADGDEPAGGGPQGDLKDAVIEPLWAELDVAVSACLARLSLNDLILRAEAKGMRRNVSDPLTFSI